MNIHTRWKAFDEQHEIWLNQNGRRKGRRKKRPTVQTDNQSKRGKSIDLFTTCPSPSYIYTHLYSCILYLSFCTQDVHFIWLYRITFKQCVNSTCFAALLFCIVFISNLTHFTQPNQTIFRNIFVSMWQWHVRVRFDSIGEIESEAATKKICLLLIFHFIRLVRWFRFLLVCANRHVDGTRVDNANMVCIWNWLVISNPNFGWISPYFGTMYLDHFYCRLIHNLAHHFSPTLYSWQERERERSTKIMYIKHT